MSRTNARRENVTAEDATNVIRDEERPALEADEEISVSPFLELDTMFGSSIWLRKSTIAAVKAGGVVPDYPFGNVESPKPKCTVFASGHTFEVAHPAEEVIAALGQAEL